MQQSFTRFFSAVILLLSSSSLRSQAQSDSLVLRDLAWDTRSPAGMSELFIPSEGSMIAGFIYRANGPGRHPTLLLLHGYPGNERHLDLAQAVRAHGWNVIYFDYRGSWGSQGKFAFKNCVEDVVNVVAYCRKNQESLKIDTSNIVLFGHSMGGWVCLKALQRLPEVKKGFALSAWDIYPHFRGELSKSQLDALNKGEDAPGTYFVLNSSVKEIFGPVLKDTAFYNLANDGKALADKQVVMLDENPRNKMVADALKPLNTAYFTYNVWRTDHPFTNKRASLIRTVIAFLDR
ncbi:MAG: alpha/beta fold hydrolase [Bacteroidetes bacterium]|nr:alpha/beta fold hydrolase [Bacteroidota bacterium]